MSLSLIRAADCFAVALFLYFVLAFRDHRRRRGQPYPPGPPSRPTIGNLLDIPNEAPWIAYADTSKKFGDVICLRILGQVVAVLCSSSAIKDLFEKHGEVYADRPTLPIVEITEMDWLLFRARKGEVWREGRKLLERSLRPGAMVTVPYRQMMQENTRMFLSRLLATPKEFRRHINLLQGRLVMSLTYSYDLKEGDDIIVAPVQATKRMSPLMLPGAALVNNLPFCAITFVIKTILIPSWVPWLSYRPLVKMLRTLGEKMKNDPINFVKNAMHEGTTVSSLASEHLREIESIVSPERQNKEDIVKITLGSMFSTGSDSTVSSMSSLFLALVLYPQVQSRVQIEPDTVVGRDWLPTFDDRPRLPYIDEMCRELVRWQMVTPMGLPHASAEDDVYKGFFIPKGSIMIANAWAILHDPEKYQDPEEFRPERYLDQDGSFQDDPAVSLAFGGGKRICPGRHFVDSTLLIVTLSILSVFNVTKSKDENGQEIPVKVAMTI